LTEAVHHARTPEAAVRTLERFNLGNLLDRHEHAIELYMEARRAHAEARRQHQDAVDYVATCELDAVLEMEQDPEYVPGKNAEARKQQAEVFLARAGGVQTAKRQEKATRLAVDDRHLEVDHARARVDHLELQIAARRSELDLIASFARGAA